MVSETSSEASSAMVTVSANGRKSSPAMPPTRATGRNTATVVSVEAVTAAATSRTAVRMALRLVLAVGQVPLDVLDDHDGVVHHAADGDGQRAQGQHVQRVAAGAQPDEGDQQGERDGDRGDQGGADREQEDQDHDHGEAQAQQALDGEVVDRLLDERAPGRRPW